MWSYEQSSKTILVSYYEITSYYKFNGKIIRRSEHVLRPNVVFSMWRELMYYWIINIQCDW